MIQGLFSIRKPKYQSKEFYKTFYRCYSLVQINDIIMKELLDNLSEYQKAEYIRLLIKDGLDMDRASAHMVCLGVVDGSLEKRKQEDRGLDISLLIELQNKNIEPLEWYLSANEFMHLYAVCEQGIKDFLAENFVDIENFKESQIIKKLFDALGDERDEFLKIVYDNTDSILEKENEVRAVWGFYTNIRNVFMHAGGRITPRFISNMNDFLEKWRSELDAIRYSESMRILWTWREKSDFFEIADSELMVLDNAHLNFFRNFVLIIIEALDEITCM